MHFRNNYCAVPSSDEGHVKLSLITKLYLRSAGSQRMRDGEQCC